MRYKRTGNDYTQRAARAQAGLHIRDQKIAPAHRRSASIVEAPIQPVFFTLEIRGAAHKQQALEQWPVVKELVAGHTYTLVLKASVNKGGSNGASLEQQMYPEGIKIAESLELHLQLPPEAQLPPETRKSMKQGALSYTLTYQETRSPFQRYIQFTLSPRARTQTARILLKCREQGSPFLDDFGQFSIQIRGKYNLEDRLLLQQCQINASLPAHVALLSITTLESFSGERGQRLKLRGWSQRGKQLEDSPVAEPEASASIMELRKGDGKEESFKKDPEAIINTLSNFSRTFSPKLAGWLLQISRHQADQEQPCLIIVDNTYLEIPWEMLVLEPMQAVSDGPEASSGQYACLGATVQIARWLPFKYFKSGRWLSVQKREHIGTILSYIDSDLDKDKTAPERQILQHLGAQAYPTLPELTQSMSQPLLDVGLVYIGCHGHEGKTLKYVNGASSAPQTPSAKLKSVNLEALYATTDPHLTVFVNACEAARVIRNSQLNLSSFVEGFLTHCAGGFIGPLAPVTIQNASQIARDLLTIIYSDPVSSDPKANIAEALRVLRTRAVQTLQAARKLPEGNQRTTLHRQVLDMFMYVYYGNPLAHLRLPSVSSEPERMIPEGALPSKQGEKEEA